MAAKKPLSSGKSGGDSKKRQKKSKVPQPKTPMQRVAVMGVTGKLRMEWRPWG